MTYSPNTPWYSDSDERAVFNPERAATEFLTGAVQGGLYEGGRYGLSKLNESLPNFMGRLKEDEINPQLKAPEALETELANNERNVYNEGIGNELPDTRELGSSSESLLPETKISTIPDSQGGEADADTVIDRLFNDATKADNLSDEGAGDVGKIINEIKYQPSSGAIFKANPDKTTTILGSFDRDMKNIVNEMGNVKSTYFGAKKGGFNVLNVPDEMCLVREDR